MIRDRFLAILFPDLPEDGQVQSQIKSLENETVAPKMPTSFLTLPSELRQDVLIRTYHPISTTAIQCWNDPMDNGRDWLQAFHKTQIEAWASTLQLVDENIIDDVEYVKNKWLGEVETLPPSFLPCPKLWGWQDISEDDRKAIWTLTQTGEEPWRRIHRKLYILNRQWNYCRYAKMSLVDRERYADNYPPWDKQGGSPKRNIHGDYEAKRWRQGPSGIVWEAFSSSHHPWTWKRLQDAVDGDITWIVQTEKEYQAELARVRSATASEDLPVSLLSGAMSGITERLANFRGLY